MISRYTKLLLYLSAQKRLEQRSHCKIKLYFAYL